LIIAVTGLNTAGEPEAGFGVLKSLQEDRGSRSCRLIGLACREMETGLFHPGLMDKAYIVPSPRLDQEAFLHRIRQIKAADGLDIIIPNLAAEIGAFSDMETELRRMEVRTLLPGRQALKEIQAETVRQFKIKKNRPPEQNSTPAVFPSSLTKNPVTERYAQSSSTIVDLFAVAIIADRKNRLVALAAAKKILASRQGGTWIALTVDGEQFRSKAEKLVRNTGWQGPLTFEIAVNEKGEQFPAGIHPVFPDWINLAGAAHANLPSILIDVIQGGKFKGIIQAEAGRMLVRSAVDIVTDLNQFGNISLTGEYNYDGQ